jgi:hypothetical protein
VLRNRKTYIAIFINASVTARTLKNKTRKETNPKFYNIMAVPVLLYGSETWTLRKRDWNRIQAAGDVTFKNSSRMH